MPRKPSKSCYPKQIDAKTSTNLDETRLQARLLKFDEPWRTKMKKRKEAQRQMGLRCRLVRGEGLAEVRSCLQGDAYVASGTALRLVWANQGLTTQRVSEDALQVALAPIEDRCSN
ncbi:hypothetical protein COLO4_16472 [Corchorus olitorius]|uniref:Uncharacterized protein n=1 Tax=Corchorus olitorius TaxID=93759 RepID=A0A1R3JHH8_9ROSI|nr:hypothetical protein COLO4_16472 [Corchorus olitorius]